jgi:3-oxoacyl-[acyl-carrier protein] reductase
LLLSGKNAIITGCLKGIGRATVEVFAEQGANVWACALTPDEEFESFCDALAEDNGCWVKPVYFDLCDGEAVKAGLRTIQADKLPVDCLINVAGLTVDALFHMTTREQLDLVFNVNLFSQIMITQYCTKLMMRHKNGGAVVNVASIAGIDGGAGQLAYSSSKAGLIGFTKTLARELGDRGIRVNAVAPGVIDTDMNSVVPTDVLTKRLAQTSLGRIGSPREVAGTIAYLASDLAAYVTGQVLRIDGGMK